MALNRQEQPGRKTRYLCATKGGAKPWGQCRWSNRSIIAANGNAVGAMLSVSLSTSFTAAGNTNPRHRRMEASMAVWTSAQRVDFRTGIEADMLAALTLPTGGDWTGKMLEPRKSIQNPTNEQKLDLIDYRIDYYYCVGIAIDEDDPDLFDACGVDYCDSVLAQFPGAA